MRPSVLQVHELQKFAAVASLGIGVDRRDGRHEFSALRRCEFHNFAAGFTDDRLGFDLRFVVEPTLIDHGLPDGGTYLSLQFLGPSIERGPVDKYRPGQIGVEGRSVIALMQVRTVADGVLERILLAVDRAIREERDGGRQVHGPRLGAEELERAGLYPQETNAQTAQIGR